MSITGFNRRRRELEQAEIEKKAADTTNAEAEEGVEQAELEKKAKNTRKTTTKE